MGFSILVHCGDYMQFFLRCNYFDFQSKTQHRSILMHVVLELFLRDKLSRRGMFEQLCFLGLSIFVKQKLHYLLLGYFVWLPTFVICTLYTFSPFMSTALPQLQHQFITLCIVRTYIFSFYAHTYRLFCLLQFFCPLFCN